MNFFEELSESLQQAIRNVEHQNRVTHQTSQTVSELIDKINAEIHPEGEEGTAWRNHLLSVLDFGLHNIHLTNPLNLLPVGHPRHQFFTQDREVPLTGDEIVYGNYLLFSYMGHKGEGAISVFPDLPALEKVLLGGGGLRNPFSSYLVPVVHGEVKKLSYNEKENTLEWLS